MRPPSPSADYKNDLHRIVHLFLFAWIYFGFNLDTLIVSATRLFLARLYWLSVGVGVVMSVVLSNHHRRRHILLVAVACLCVLLGGPPYAAGADSLTIAGQTYDEPGVSGSGWAARTLLLLAVDRVRAAASLACTPPMASLPWTPPGWTRPAP